MSGSGIAAAARAFLRPRTAEAETAYRPYPHAMTAGKAAVGNIQRGRRKFLSPEEFGTPQHVPPPPCPLRYLGLICGGRHLAGGREGSRLGESEAMPAEYEIRAD